MRKYVDKLVKGSFVPSRNGLGDLWDKLKQSCRSLMNTQVSALTLGEVCITLGVIGALVILLIPVIKGAKPDEKEAMHKKATFIVERIVNELASDEFLYPRSNDYNGLGNTSAVVVNGVEHKGKEKFCSLFISRLNIKAGTTTNCNVYSLADSNAKPNAISAEGIAWYFPISNFQNGAETLTVDVNGSEPPNQIGQDRFQYKVQPGFKVTKNIPTLKSATTDPGAKPKETKPTDRSANDNRPTMKTYSIKAPTSSYATIYGAGGGKVNGTYIVMAIPKPGYKCSWFTQQVTILNADETLPTLTCDALDVPWGPDAATWEGPTTNDDDDEQDDDKDKKYCINATLVDSDTGAESEHCVIEGTGCDKIAGQIYKVTLTSLDPKNYKIPWDVREILMGAQDEDLGKIECAYQPDPECYALTDARSSYAKTNCPMTLPEPNCPNEGEEHLYEKGVHNVVIAPKPGFFYKDSVDPLEESFYITDADINIEDKNVGSCSSTPTSLLFDITSVAGGAPGDTQTAVTTITSDKPIPADIDIKFIVSGTYESCYMEDGLVKPYTLPDDEATFEYELSPNSTTEMNLVYESPDNDTCGLMRTRNDRRIVYPESWSVEINGRSYTLGQATQFTVDGIQYSFNNTGFPAEDYGCACEDSRRGNIQVTLNIEENDSVKQATIEFSVKDQRGEDPDAIYYGSVITGPSGSKEVFPAFPSNYEIIIDDFEALGDNDTCQLEMTEDSPSPNPVSVAADVTSPVIVNFQCTGECMPKYKYNVTVNESLCNDANKDGACESTSPVGGAPGWEATPGISDLPGGETFIIRFPGKKGYSIKTVTFIEAEGRSHYYDGSILDFEIDLCTDLTVDIVYETATIDIEVGELNIAYTGANTSGVDPEIIDNGGNQFDVRTLQDAIISGFTVTPSTDQKSWTIQAVNGLSFNPVNGSGQKSLGVTVEAAKFGDGCFKAVYDDGSAESQEICLNRGADYYGTLQILLKHEHSGTLSDVFDEYVGTESAITVTGPKNINGYLRGTNGAVLEFADMPLGEYEISAILEEVPDDFCGPTICYDGKVSYELDNTKPVIGPNAITTVTLTVKCKCPRKECSINNYVYNNTSDPLMGSYWAEIELRRGDERLGNATVDVKTPALFDKLECEYNYSVVILGTGSTEVDKLEVTATATPASYTPLNGKQQTEIKLESDPATLILEKSTPGANDIEPAVGTYTIAKGNPISLSATAEDEYDFKKWEVKEGDCVVANPTSLSTTVTVPKGGQDRCRVNALFTYKVHTLFVNFEVKEAGTASTTGPAGSVTNDPVATAPANWDADYPVKTAYNHTATTSTSDDPTDLIPVIACYTANKTSVSGTMPNQDVTEKITYTRNVRKLTIKYQYEDGTTAAPSVTLDNLKACATYSFTNPVVPNFSPDPDPLEVAMPDKDHEVIVKYKRKYHVLTVSYQYADGSVAKVVKPGSTSDANCSDKGAIFGDSLDAANGTVGEYNQCLGAGQTYSLTSPTIANYTAEPPIVEGTMPDSDLNVTVTYKRNQWTLTVHYVDEAGNKLHDDYVSDPKIDAGATYSVQSPTITNYTPVSPASDSPHKVTGTMPDKDHEVTVTYKRNQYDLIINYKYENGTQAAPQYKANPKINAGDTYSVTSPEIVNYEPDIPVVEGTMPDKPAGDKVEVTVTYKAKENCKMHFSLKEGSLSPADINADMTIAGGKAGSARLNAANSWAASVEQLLCAANYTVTGACSGHAVCPYLVTAEPASINSLTGEQEVKVDIQIDPTKVHKLTIKYVDENGNALNLVKSGSDGDVIHGEGGSKNTFVKEYIQGESYDHPSPPVTNMSPDKATVSGTMGTEDVEVTVTYSSTLGCMKLTLDMSGSPTAVSSLAASQIKLAVTGNTEFNKTLTGKHGATIEICDLVPGDYTVLAETVSVDEKFCGESVCGQGTITYSTDPGTIKVTSKNTTSATLKQKCDCKGCDISITPSTSLTIAYGGTNTTNSTPTITGSKPNYSISYLQDATVSSFTITPTCAAKPWEIVNADTDQAIMEGWGVSTSSGTGTKSGVTVTFSKNHLEGKKVCMTAKYTTGPTGNADEICFNLGGIEQSCKLTYGYRDQQGVGATQRKMTVWWTVQDLKGNGCPPLTDVKIPVQDCKGVVYKNVVPTTTSGSETVTYTLQNFGTHYLGSIADITNWQMVCDGYSCTPPSETECTQGGQGKVKVCTAYSNAKSATVSNSVSVSFKPEAGGGSPISKTVSGKNGDCTELHLDPNLYEVTLGTPTIGTGFCDANTTVKASSTDVSVTKGGTTDLTITYTCTNACDPSNKYNIKVTETYAAHTESGLAAGWGNGSGPWWSSYTLSREGTASNVAGGTDFSITFGTPSARVGCSYDESIDCYKAMIKSITVNGEAHSGDISNMQICKDTNIAITYGMQGVLTNNCSIKFQLASTSAKPSGESVTVSVTGGKTAKATLSSSNNWTATINDLPCGENYTPTAKMDKADSEYSATVSPTLITQLPSSTTVTVTLKDTKHKVTINKYLDNELTTTEEQNVDAGSKFTYTADAIHPEEAASKYTGYKIGSGTLNTSTSVVINSVTADTIVNLYYETLKKGTIEVYVKAVPTACGDMGYAVNDAQGFMLVATNSTTNAGYEISCAGNPGQDFDTYPFCEQTNADRGSYTFSHANYTGVADNSTGINDYLKITNVTSDTTTMTSGGTIKVYVTIGCGAEATAGASLVIQSATGGTTTPAAGTHNVNKNTWTSIVATPQSGATFDKWTKVSGDCTIESATSASTRVKVTGSTCTIKPAFKVPASVSLSVGSNNTSCGTKKCSNSSTTYTWTGSATLKNNATGTTYTFAPTYKDGTDNKDTKSLPAGTYTITALSLKMTESTNTTGITATSVKLNGVAVNGTLTIDNGGTHNWGITGTTTCPGATCPNSTIKLQIGTLSAKYPDNSGSGSATANGTNIVVEYAKDVNVTGVSVVPSSSSMKWKIVELNPDVQAVIAPTSGTGTTGITVTMSASFLNNDSYCIYAQSTEDSTIKSETVCYGRDMTTLGNNVAVTTNYYVDGTKVKSENSSVTSGAKATFAVPATYNYNSINNVYQKHKVTNNGSVAIDTTTRADIVINNPQKAIIIDLYYVDPNPTGAVKVDFKGTHVDNPAGNDGRYYCSNGSYTVTLKHTDGTTQTVTDSIGYTGGNSSWNVGDLSAAKTVPTGTYSIQSVTATCGDFAMTNYTTNPSGSVTVSKGGTVTITVNATFSGDLPTGAINIALRCDKSAAVNCDAVADFAFSLNSPDMTTSYTIEGSSSQDSETIDDLVIGDYTLSSTSITTNSGSSPVCYNGATPTGVFSVNPVTVTASNTYSNPANTIFKYGCGDTKLNVLVSANSGAVSGCGLQHRLITLDKSINTAINVSVEITYTDGSTETVRVPISKGATTGVNGSSTALASCSGKNIKKVEPVSTTYTGSVYTFTYQGYQPTVPTGTIKVTCLSGISGASVTACNYTLSGPETKTATAAGSHTVETGNYTITPTGGSIKLNGTSYNATGTANPTSVTVTSGGTVTVTITLSATVTQYSVFTSYQNEGGLNIKDSTEDKVYKGGSHTFVCPATITYNGQTYNLKTTPASLTNITSVKYGTCVYSAQTYAVTAKHYLEGSTTTKVKADVSVGNKANGTYSYTCPTTGLNSGYTNYSPTQVSVSYTVNGAATTVTCYYKLNSYTITTNYKAGSTVIKTATTATANKGSKYTYSCPATLTYNNNTYNLTSTPAEITSVTANASGTCQYAVNVDNDCSITFIYKENDLAPRMLTGEISISGGVSKTIDWSGDEADLDGGAVVSNLTCGKAYSWTGSLDDSDSHDYTMTFDSSSYTFGNSTENKIVYVSYYLGERTSGSIKVTVSVSDTTYKLAGYTLEYQGETNGQITYAPTSYTQTSHSQTKSVYVGYYLVDGGGGSATLYNGVRTCPATITCSPTNTFTVSQGTTSNVTCTVTPADACRLYTITTNYKKSDGTVIQAATTTQVAYGGSHTFSCPAIAGYTLKTTPTALSNITANKSGDCIYNTAGYTVTTNYKSGDLNLKVATTASVTYGASYSFTCPDTITYDTNKPYKLKTTPSALSNITSNKSGTCEYYAPLSVTTVYTNVPGTVIKTATTEYVAYNGSYTFSCPATVTYNSQTYNLKTTPTALSSITSNKSGTCVYDVATYTVTTYYKDTNGTALKTATTNTVASGGSHTFSCPATVTYNNKTYTLKTTPSALSNITSNKSGTCTYTAPTTGTVKIKFVCDSTYANCSEPMDFEGEVYNDDYADDAAAESKTSGHTFTFNNVPAGSFDTVAYINIAYDAGTFCKSGDDAQFTSDDGVEKAITVVAGETKTVTYNYGCIDPSTLGKPYLRLVPELGSCNITCNGALSGQTLQSCEITDFYTAITGTVTSGISSVKYSTGISKAAFEPGSYTIGINGYGQEFKNTGLACKTSGFNITTSKSSVSLAYGDNTAVTIKAVPKCECDANWTPPATYTVTTNYQDTNGTSIKTSTSASVTEGSSYTFSCPATVSYGGGTYTLKTTPSKLTNITANKSGICVYNAPEQCMVGLYHNTCTLSSRGKVYCIPTRIELKNSAGTVLKTINTPSTSTATLGTRTKEHVKVPCADTYTVSATAGSVSHYPGSSSSEGSHYANPTISVSPTSITSWNTGTNSELENLKNQIVYINGNITEYCRPSINYRSSHSNQTDSNILQTKVFDAFKTPKYGSTYAFNAPAITIDGYSCPAYSYTFGSPNYICSSGIDVYCEKATTTYTVSYDYKVNNLTGRDQSSWGWKSFTVNANSQHTVSCPANATGINASYSDIPLTSITDSGGNTYSNNQKITVTENISLNCYYEEAESTANAEGTLKIVAARDYNVSDPSIETAHEVLISCYSGGCSNASYQAYLEFYERDYGDNVELSLPAGTYSLNITPYWGGDEYQAGVAMCDGTTAGFRNNSGTVTITAGKTSTYTFYLTCPEL